MSLYFDAISPEAAVHEGPQRIDNRQQSHALARGLMIWELIFWTRGANLDQEIVN